MYYLKDKISKAPVLVLANCNAKSLASDPLLQK